jgi:L-asparaginase
MKRLSILVILTGGTFGSVINTASIDLAESASQAIATSTSDSALHNEHIDFTTTTPYTIHSENLEPKHWQTLIQHIEAHSLDRFDGIIVTHGTDTLAYTAAALGLFFHQLPIPILLVSSNLPLSNPIANGKAHWQHALSFIQHHRSPGCYVPYQNPGQALRMHHGTRLLSCLPLSSDFISIQHQQPTYSQHQKTTDINKKSYVLKPDFSTSILVIRPYPGLDYRSLNLTGVTAVLHDLYHSGTTCTTQTNADTGLLAFLKRCRQHNISCFFAPALKADNYYPSTQMLIDNGGEMIWNMSLEAAYVKLLLAYGNFDNLEAIRAFLETNIAYETV